MSAPAADDRLLLDLMLGKLAVYLRMCGWDAAYAGDRGLEADEVIHRIAAAEDRVVVTRDRGLARQVDRGVLLERREVADQVAELRSLGMQLELCDPPIRCGRCNGILDPGPAEQTRPSYAPDDPAIACYRCRSCAQYFWKGSHWAAVRDVLAERSS